MSSTKKINEIIDLSLLSDEDDDDLESHAGQVPAIMAAAVAKIKSEPEEEAFEAKESEPMESASHNNSAEKMTVETQDTTTHPSESAGVEVSLPSCSESDDDNNNNNNNNNNNERTCARGQQPWESRPYDGTSTSNGSKKVVNLTDDASVELDSRGSTSSKKKCVATSEDLQYTYEEGEIHPKVERRLRDLGVVTMEQLGSKRGEFEVGGVKGVSKETQERLFNICCMYVRFREMKQASSGSIWRDYFTEDSFHEFRLQTKRVENCPLTASITEERRYRHAVNMLHIGGQGELSQLSEEEHNRICTYGAKEVMKKLPTSLKRQCRFDVKEFTFSFVKAIFNFPTGDPYPETFLIAGRTQAGKTPVKVVAHAVCEELFCPHITITKGVAESKDLQKKVKMLGSGDTEHSTCPIRHWLKEGSNNKRSVIIADTAAQIKKATKNIVEPLRDIRPTGKFAVIIDECDAMYRTADRYQQMEQAYEALMDFAPALRIEISATPIPALMAMTEQGQKVKMLQIGTSSDYSGITEMKPLQDSLGKDIFLDISTIKPKEGVPYTCKENDLGLVDFDLEPLFEDHDEDDDCTTGIFSSRNPNSKGIIPCTGEDDSVMSLYDAALSRPDQDGVLVLDCTNPRVQAIYNVFEKAARVQNHYKSKGKDLAIVVFVGRGIYIRRPGFSRGRFVKKATVSAVLDRLDEQLGLSVPIFIFGYSKMRRCISYRSAKRVPTHMVLSLGTGYSNESLIQALGRATFNGLDSVLKQNGHNHVTVLTSEDDLIMATKYMNFVHAVQERLDNGDSPDDAIKGAKKRFKDDENFLRHTNRKTGQVKEFKHKLPDQDAFKAPSQYTDVSNKRKRYDSDEFSKRVMKAILDLADEDDIYACRTRDIREKYEDTYQDVIGINHTLRADQLKKILTAMKRDNLLEKDGEHWTAKNLDVLRAMLNPGLMGVIDLVES